MGLLQTLCLVKMDNTDGNTPTAAAAKQDQVDGAEDDAAAGSKNPEAAAGNKVEMKGETRPEAAPQASQKNVLVSGH